MLGLYKYNEEQLTRSYNWNTLSQHHPAYRLYVNQLANLELTDASVKFIISIATLLHSWYHTLYYSYRGIRIIVNSTFPTWS